MSPRSVTFQAHHFSRSLTGTTLYLGSLRRSKVSSPTSSMVKQAFPSELGSNNMVEKRVWSESSVQWVSKGWFSWVPRLVRGFLSKSGLNIQEYDLSSVTWTRSETRCSLNLWRTFWDWWQVTDYWQLKRMNIGKWGGWWIPLSRYRICLPVRCLVLNVLVHLRILAEMDQYHVAIDSLLRIFTGHVIAARDPEQGVVLPIYEWSECFDVSGLLYRTDLNYHLQCQKWRLTSSAVRLFPTMQTLFMIHTMNSLLHMKRSFLFKMAPTWLGWLRSSVYQVLHAL